MDEPIRTTRPFKERVIEGFDRSRLRQEALKVRRKRFQKIRTRYGRMVLGASLAVGGVGIPMTGALTAPDLPEQTREAQPPEFENEMSTARRIAIEVAGGVDEALPFGRSVEKSLTESQKGLITEQARENFFRTEIPFGSIIYSEAKKNNLDPALVAAVVKTESQFKPTAKSGAGARGLMQLMPKTGAWMGATNLMNPADNVKAGAKYLKYLNERFDNDPVKVLAAYNAGEGNVRRYGGVPPFRETQNYVKKVNKAHADFNQQVLGAVAEAVETGVAPGSVASTVAR